MTERVGIQYDIQGADQGAQEIARLKESVVSVGTATEQTAPAVAAFESVTRTAGESAIAAAEGTDSFGRSAGEVAQRVQGMAGQVAALVSHLGGGAAGRAAGLVGSIAGVVAQSIQMGATMGPGGAVVGALSGLIPIVIQLAEGHDQAAEAAARQAAAETHLASAVTAAIEARRRASGAADVRAGVFGTDTSDADLQRLAEEQRQHILTAERTLARVGEGEHSRLEQAMIDRVRHQADEWRTQLRGIETEIDRRSEAEQAATVVSHAATEQTEHHTHAARALAEAHRAVAQSVADASEAEQRFIADMMGASGTGSMPGLGFGESASDATIAQLARGTEEYQRQQRERAKIEQTQHRLEQQFADEKAAKERVHHAERMRHEQEFVNALQQTGSTIGSVFGAAFQSAVDGQENFGDAFARGSKQMLAQLGERYIAEGAGALFEAVGFAFTNPPAAGAKAIEGAGKVALGVSLGAASSAIHPPPAPGSADSKPESPHGDKGKSGAATAAPPVVININSPSLIGGTEQQWGRGAERAIESARRRLAR